MRVGFHRVLGRGFSDTWPAWCHDHPPAIFSNVIAVAFHAAVAKSRVGVGGKTSPTRASINGGSHGGF
jgi:hypothetical protein